MNGAYEVYELLLHSCNADTNEIDLGQPPLITAVKLGSVSVVDQLLGKPNVEVNIGDQQQRAALWWAAHGGDIKMAQRLLSHRDILIDRADAIEGLTPLAIATRCGHLQIMEHLLRTGRPNINFRDKCGRTPIFHAIGRRNKRAVEILLAEDTINLAHQDGHGRSPLSYAVAEACQFAVEMLLEKGADMYLDEGNGLTAFQQAVQTRDPEIVALMLEYASARPILGDMNRPNRERRSLHLAAADGMADIVGMLLDYGYDVDARDPLGRTALHLAAAHNHPSVVRRLLQSSTIDVLAKDCHCFTPLHAAAQAGSAEVVSLLLDHTDIHLNWETAHGATALWLATQGGHDEAAERLLQEPSLEVNAVGKDITLGRSTSLHHAVKHQSLRIVQLLLKNATLNPNQLDYAMRTPLCWAADNGDLQMVDLLLDRNDLFLNAVGVIGQSPLWLAVQGNHLKTVERLLQAPVIDVNNGWADQTPLLKALKCEHLEVSRMLLAHARLDINARDCQGHSALTWSVCAGLDKVVQEILRRSDVEVNEAAGQSALW